MSTANLPDDAHEFYRRYGWPAEPLPRPSAAIRGTLEGRTPHRSFFLRGYPRFRWLSK